MASLFNPNSNVYIRMPAARRTTGLGQTRVDARKASPKTGDAWDTGDPDCGVALDYILYMRLALFGRPFSSQIWRFRVVPGSGR